MKYGNVKYVNRMRLCDEYYPPSMENWLSEQAKKGWLAEFTPGLQLRFWKDVAADIQYRMEPAQDVNEKPPADMLELYEQAGWEFVGVLYEMFYLWKSTRPDAEELHTDPIVQSAAYDWMYKRYKRRITWSVVCMLVLFALQMDFAFVRGNTLEYTARNPYSWLYLCMMVPAVAQWIISSNRVRKLKRRMEDGIPMDRSEDFRKTDKAQRIILMILYGCVAFGIIAWIILLLILLVMYAQSYSIS